LRIRFEGGKEKGEKVEEREIEDVCASGYKIGDLIDLGFGTVVEWHCCGCVGDDLQKILCV
jgi:thymidine phosphorylase